MNLDDLHASDPVAWQSMADAGRIPSAATANDAGWHSPSDDTPNVLDWVANGIARHNAAIRERPTLRSVVAEGNGLIDHLRAGLTELSALHDPQRTVYPNGTQVTLADAHGDVVLEIGGEYVYLDEIQTAELAADLLWRAIKVHGAKVDWRLRAAHLALRDIHDDDDPWAS